jgi:hypothetical protein
MENTNKRNYKRQNNKKVAWKPKLVLEASTAPHNRYNFTPFNCNKPELSNTVGLIPNGGEMSKIVWEERGIYRAFPLSHLIVVQMSRKFVHYNTCPQSKLDIFSRFFRHLRGTELWPCMSFPTHATPVRCWVNRESHISPSVLNHLPSGLLR